jgi:hypothetical protein
MKNLDNVDVSPSIRRAVQHSGGRNHFRSGQSDKYPGSLSADQVTI